jgi:hypothetical protein
MASQFGQPFPGVDASGRQDPRAHAFEVVTQAARLAMTGMPAGYTVHDSTVHKLVTYDGTSWYLADGTAAATS